MGAYLSEPITEKESEDGSGNNVKFGASSMQGWRVSQEDAHNCVAEFDKDSSFFAVYDGHGGAEVAVYLSRHLPDLLKKTEGYSKEDASDALTQAFLKMDASIKEPEVLAEIQKIAKVQNGEDESGVDYEDENVGQLYEEATMPLDKLVAQYTHNGSDVKVETSESESGGPSPGSSRKIVFKTSRRKSGDQEPATSVDDSDKVKVESSSSKTEDVVQEESTSATSNAVKIIEETASPSLLTTKSKEKAEVVQKLKVDIDGSGDSSDNCKTEASSNGSKSEIENSSSDSVKDRSILVECVNGQVDSSSDSVNQSKQLTNGVETVNKKEETDSIDSKLPEASPKPRKGKVHPVPMTVIVTQESPSKKSVRVSPRKGRNVSNMAFDDSESDFDSSDSDEPDAGKFPEVNSSSSDEDCDEEEDEDEEEDSDDDDDDEEDDSFLNDIQEPGYDSGCTAVVSFLKWNGDKLNLWVANAGDSRCVVSRNGEALEMSYDHKPESEVEALRIVNAGGKVTEDGRVNGGLNLSRAIGDHSYKQNAVLSPEEQMISPLPSIQHVELDPSLDDFIILACDGIWNSMTSQEVVDFVASRIKTAPSLSKICEELFDACLSPDTYGDGTGCDNMTAIIVQLTKGSNGIKRSRDEAEIDESSKKPKLDV